MATEVKVPTLGESITEATLGAWLKQPGDAVALDEPIASLETDKVALDVPAPAAGTMGDQRVKVGDTVAVGAVIATIEEGAAPAKKAGLPESTPVNPKGAGENIEPKKEAAAEEEAPHLTLSPAVRRTVLEHHLDPSKIKGTGKDGRLTKDDVLAAAAEGQKAESPSAPAKAGAQPGRGFWVPAFAGTQGGCA
jgi:2-oxoglutarate dehydrogenase E2 component (dihydrolipoamide succinyltransferase)